MKTSINVSHCSYTAFAQYSFYQLGVVFSQLLVCNHNMIIIIIIITDFYSAFMSEDTEALDAAQSEFE